MSLCGMTVLNKDGCRSEKLYLISWFERGKDKNRQEDV